MKTLEPKISNTPPAPSASGGVKPVNPFALSWRFDRARGEFVVRAGARVGGLAVVVLALLTGAGLAFLLGTAFRAGAAGDGEPARVVMSEPPLLTSEPAPPQRAAQQPAPKKQAKPQAKPARKPKSAERPDAAAAAKGAKSSVSGSHARQAGLNYLILKSFPNESEAAAAREAIARKGVTTTVERNLPGWAGKGWYSVVGTNGFNMERERSQFDRHVKDLKAMKLDPKPYRWRGTEMASGD
jgi:hypothetical protein